MAATGGMDHGQCPKQYRPRVRAMIRVKVARQALAELRITTSALWDTLGSLSSLALGRASVWPYSEWSRAAERALYRRRGAELVAWVRRLPGPIPPLLTPVPTDPTATIEQEIDALVHRLSRVPERQLAPLVAAGETSRSPEAWLKWFGSALLDYWRVALVPYEEPMRIALHDDVSARAHLLATAGSDDVLSRLDGRLRWSPPVLELAGTVPSVELYCAARLVIVPLIFGRRMTRCASDSAGTVAVSYQARGAALLHKARLVMDRGRPPAEADRLALLLGRGKAAVLRGLAVPTTTSELAEALGMSASTVSQHLSTLLTADVVHKRRIGVRVVYALDGAGVALLKYFDSNTRRPAV
jgi:DNA-binding transcriptional ArsR family regulator